MNAADRPPLISVIIPTFNRADLLKSSLESLATQSIPRYHYELVVVDDGSIDATSKVCKRLSSKVNIKYLRIENSGISAAKNLGVFASSSPTLLFFDDDDIADTNLLGEHLKTHSNYPQENVAVLGYTTWAPSLQVNEVMNYVTDIGHFLFSYGDLKDGQELDFDYFWGGRSSCKRSLLVKHGVFNQQFRFGSEDIELGYRLSKLGLKVIFNRRAVQYMNRPVDYDEFCRRCEKQGLSQFPFSQTHSEPIIQEYCQVTDAVTKWQDLRNVLEINVRRVHEIERILESQTVEPTKLLPELLGLYQWTFNAFKMKGIITAMRRRNGERPVDEVAISAASASALGRFPSGLHHLAG